MFDSFSQFDSYSTDMKDETRTNASILLQQVMRAFSVVMVLCYFAAGITLLVQPSLLANCTTMTTLLLGSILLLYGTFRACRLFRKIFRI